MLDIAQQQDDAETGEAEHKDQRASREQGRSQQRQPHLPPQVPGRATQGAGRFLNAHRLRAPVPAQDVQGDGVVVKNVGEEDEGETAFEREWVFRERQDVHEPAIHQTEIAQQRLEGSGHHDRGQDKGQGSQSEQDRLAAKVIGSHDLGGRQGEQQRQ